jgi:hypothetical protein
MIADHAEAIWKWIYTTLLRVMVNRLIDQFQNQVVNWIAGGGSPKFVTDWKGFLKKAGGDAAGIAIQKYIPGLCRSFGPLVRLQLEYAYKQQPQTTCTLDQVVQNVQNFYNDFSNGGWVAYSAVTLPSGNYYGSLLETSNMVQLEKQQAAEAAKNDAGAAQGFLGVKKCTNPKTVTFPNTNEGWDAFGGSGDKYTLEKEPVCEKAQGEGGTCTAILCGNGDYGTVTPGTAVAQSLNISLGSKVSQIVSAQRLEELVAALINASINRVIQFGLTSLTSAMNGTSASEAGSAGAPPVTAADVNTALQFADTYNQQYQTVIDTDSKWLALEPQVVQSLAQVAANCSSTASSTTDKSNQLSTLVKPTQDEMSSVQASIAKLQTIVGNIKNETNNDKLSQWVNQLNTSFDTTTISDMYTKAQDRYNALTQLQSTAEANLPNSCSTPL